jgi:hypothetical protein
MAKERGRNMIEGWEEMIRHEGSMGLFPGTADTTNFEESKALASNGARRTCATQNSTRTFSQLDSILSELSLRLSWLFSGTMIPLYASNQGLETKRWKNWYVLMSPRQPREMDTEECTVYPGQ